MLKGFQLIDLIQLSDKALRTYQEAALMELLQNYIYARDILPVIREMIEERLCNRIEERALECQRDGEH